MWTCLELAKDHGGVENQVAHVDQADPADETQGDGSGQPVPVDELRIIVPILRILHFSTHLVNRGTLLYHVEKSVILQVLCFTGI